MISDVEFFERIKPKLGDAETKVLIDFVRGNISSSDLVTKKDVAELKAELLKWMFGCWASILALLVGILLKVGN
mgnify:CR=1 FL=1